ncbi:MAG: CotH kinase family protein [Candidatus Omnitrophota bacterium]
MISSKTHLALFLCLAAASAAGQVVINEIHYNPPDNGQEAGSLREFVEIYNPGPNLADLSNYSFQKGIQFVFPVGTALGADGYIVLARDPYHSSWNRSRLNIYGPYEGKLSNSGENLTLLRPDGTVVDSVKYRDLPPWPQGADGYGSTLERIAWDLPSSDYHTWRASMATVGTPGAKNSVMDVPPRPVITAVEIIPPHPTSNDSVTIRLGLDAPDAIDFVNLGVERVGESETALFGLQSEWRYWPGQTAPTSGLEWTKLEFDDSQWLTGKAGFGYGDTEHLGTILNNMQNRYSTVFIRRHFAIADPASIGSLTLNIYVDDGFVCYINGAEVARYLAPETIGYQSVAVGSHEYNEMQTYSLGEGRNLLRKGDNVIALVGLNTNLSSSDLVLAPWLAYRKSQSMIAMQKVAESAQSATWEATLAPSPSQSLMRFNAEVRLKGGISIRLPYSMEPVPFYSYFVYDREINTLLPILWIASPVVSSLPSAPRSFGGAAILPVGESAPKVYDGAEIVAAHNGVKVKIVKGQEFRGNRTFNVIPEAPVRGTNAGESAPFREHLGFWHYQEMGVISSWAEFFRVVSLPASAGALQTQRLVVEQVNETMMELHGFQSDGELYKLQYAQPNWEKHTNLEEGTASIQALLKALGNPATRRETMDREIDLDEFMRYSAASVFQSNWDGFWNNNWMYKEPGENRRWVIAPWDLDWSWGSTTGAMYAKMPTTFPIDGVAVGAAQASRAPGPVTSNLHKDAEFHTQYLHFMRNELDRGFSDEKMFSKMDEMESLLRMDLEKWETQSRSRRADRHTIIHQSYTDIKTFVTQRRLYLNGALPVSVEDWEIFGS